MRAMSASIRAERSDEGSTLLYPVLGPARYLAAARDEVWFSLLPHPAIGLTVRSLIPDT